MTAAANEWRGNRVADHARHWLNVVKPDTTPFVQAVDPGSPEHDFSDLPLDYLAPGFGFVYSRTDWSPSATNVSLQLGGPTEIQGRYSVAHHHMDSGSSQIWRNGRRMATGRARMKQLRGMRSDNPLGLFRRNRSAYPPRGID
jgi:hypothetical protein